MHHSVEAAIELFIEASWGEDEYLISVQREFLVEHDALEYWRDKYFEDLVERYRGTCNSVECKDHEFLEEFDLYQELDNQIFECVICGWWYDDGEQGESINGEPTCDECAEEEKEK